MSAPIVVVGSLNMDFVAQVERLPRPGETVLGGGFRTIPGGKGANQACAAGRLGGRVRMIGRVGDDVFGEQLRESLRADGVDVQAVTSTDATPSGVALIVVQANGQNQIVVAGGANGLLTPSDVESALDEVDAGYLLLQLETPIETVAAAASMGQRRGMTVILDPAPACVLPVALLECVDILTPNESEALVLLGRREATVSLEQAPDIARALRQFGVSAVILKLGENGAFLSSASAPGPATRHPRWSGAHQHFAASSVDVVDATAAGDTFNGALAVALAEVDARLAR
jgi:ribokinase